MRFVDPSGRTAADSTGADSKQDRDNARCAESPLCNLYLLTNAASADEPDTHTQERLGVVHRDVSTAMSVAGDVLESVAEAEMVARGANIAAAAGFGVLAKFIGTKRALRTTDLGLEGKIKLLRGTVELKKGTLTVRVDMIDGKIKNPMAIFRNMKNLARGAGANTLRIEGKIGDERFDALLRSRYGLYMIKDRIDVIDIPLD